MTPKQDQDRLVELEALARSNAHRMNILEKQQDNLEELVTAVKVLAIREEKVEEDIKEIKGDVKSLTGKSGQRWDSMVEKIIGLIIAAVVGYFLAHLGMS